MNYEFSNCIKIAFWGDVKKIENGEVTLKDGKFFDIFNATDFLLEPQSQEGKPSLLHSIAKSIYIDKATPDQVKRYSITRRVIIQLDVSGRKSVLGSLSYPALVYITPHLQADILVVSHKSPEPYRF